MILTKPTLKKKKARRTALFRAISQGPERVKLIKLADFIDNLRARRGGDREHSTRRGVRMFLCTLLEEPQTDSVWKAIRFLIMEYRTQIPAYLREAR